MVGGKLVSYDGSLVGVEGGFYDGEEARICADTLLALFNMDFVAACLLEIGAQVHHD